MCSKFRGGPEVSGRAGLYRRKDPAEQAAPRPEELGAGQVIKRLALERAEVPRQLSQRPSSQFVGHRAPKPLVRLTL